MVTLETLEVNGKHPPERFLAEAAQAESGQRRL